jgi:hypothetical protein
MRRSLLPSFSLALLLGSAACGGGGDSPSDAGAPASFVAYESTFTGFHAWSNAVAAPSAGSSGDGLHGVGPMQVYWSQSPPHGSTSFPVGTIIVKETQDTDVTQRIVFAMVKRGDGFNSGGTNGWEWFSLKDAADGTASILWRGVVPPTGEVYANQAIGDCNGCHTQTTNDGVWDAALQLSKF